MFRDINEYILKPLSERQAHLDLTESCTMIGGHDSREFRGLMAHTLRTTIPKGMKIYVCHACHVHLCSNIRHMYWGTAKENCADKKANGGKSVYEYAVAKYGIDVVRERNRINGKKGGLKFAANLKKKSACEAHTDARGVDNAKAVGSNPTAGTKE